MLASPAAAIRSEINVTPLVDVVLVLLIIFMVITPLLHGYRVALPARAEGASSAVLVVRVDRDGTIHLGQEIVDVTMLSRRLASLFAARPAATVMLDADGELDYGRALGVLDAIRQSGAARIGIESSPAAAGPR